MKIKRQLCDAHAEQLRNTKLFGGKPIETSISEGDDVPCGIETREIGGKMFQIQAVKCNKLATTIFSFGRLRVIEKTVNSK
mgnify:CR=1 FL=1